MQPLVSVIIPVYCVEKYITACVQSVLCQTYQQLEVILVDDGSPDGSGGICDAFAAADARVKVLHCRNGGLSAARNRGLAQATGQYVLFLDGDDQWASDAALETLMRRQALTDADVLNFSYLLWEEDSGKKRPYFSNIPDMPVGITKQEQLQYLTQHGLYIASACNKLIRKSLLDTLAFPEGEFSEDIIWCAKLWMQAVSVDFVCENLYLYRQHPHSIRHTITPKKCSDLTKHILSCVALAEASQGQMRKSLLHYTAFQYGTFFMVQAQAHCVPQQCLDALQPYCWLLKYHGKHKKLLLLRIACAFLGFRNVCKRLRRFYGSKID